MSAKKKQIWYLYNTLENLDKVMIFKKYEASCMTYRNKVYLRLEFLWDAIVKIKKMLLFIKLTISILGIIVAIQIANFKFDENF